MRFLGVKFQPKIERRSSNFTIHPDYSPLKANIGDKNDVCLVFSEKNLFFSGEEALSTTQACLPDFDDHVNAGEFCFTAGFGSYIDENEADTRRTPNEVEGNKKTKLCFGQFLF